MLPLPAGWLVADHGERPAAIENTSMCPSRRRRRQWNGWSAGTHTRAVMLAGTNRVIHQPGIRLTASASRIFLPE